MKNIGFETNIFHWHWIQNKYIGFKKLLGNRPGIDRTDRKLPGNRPEIDRKSSKKWSRSQKTSSSQSCSHRNSVQNGPIDKFAALTGPIFVTISVFMSQGPKVDPDPKKRHHHKNVRTEILCRMVRLINSQLSRGPVSWSFLRLCLGATLQQPSGNLWTTFGQLVDNLWATFWETFGQQKWAIRNVSKKSRPWHFLFFEADSRPSR